MESPPLSEEGASCLAAYLGQLAKSFQPVSLVGVGKGALFLTNRLLCFLTPSSSSSFDKTLDEGTAVPLQTREAKEKEEGRHEEGEEDKKKDAAGSPVYELRFLLWLHHWTATERSKKTAKVRPRVSISLPFLSANSSSVDFLSYSEPVGFLS